MSIRPIGTTLSSTASIICLWLALVGPGTVLADGDVFGQKNPDPAIKMIHFPQSLTVIENTTDPAGEALKKLFEDPSPVKRTLRKLDPARIVPAKVGNTVTGPVTRASLETLGKQYGTDLILLFKREMDGKTGSRISIQGLIYFAKQKKVVPLPSHSQEVSDIQDPSALQEANLASLKRLAEAGKKAVHSYKFEVRKSNY